MWLSMSCGTSGRLTKRCASTAETASTGWKRQNDPKGGWTAAGAYAIAVKKRCVVAVVTDVFVLSGDHVGVDISAGAGVSVAVAVARCTLHVARCTLHVARCTLHVARCTLHVARVARCALRVARLPFCFLGAPRLSSSTQAPSQSRIGSEEKKLAE